MTCETPECRAESVASVVILDVPRALCGQCAADAEVWMILTAPEGSMSTMEKVA